MATVQTETITKIQFRRGTTTEREGVTLSDGEPGWDKDQKILYVGTPGGQHTPVLPIKTGGFLQWSGITGTVPPSSPIGLSVDIQSIVDSPEIIALIEAKCGSILPSPTVPGTIGDEYGGGITLPPSIPNPTDTRLYYKIDRGNGQYMILGYYRKVQINGNSVAMPTIYAESGNVQPDSEHEIVYLGEDNALAVTRDGPVEVRAKIPGGIAQGSGIYTDKLYVGDTLEMPPEGVAVLPTNTKIVNQTLGDVINNTVNNVFVNPPANMDLPPSVRINGKTLQNYILDIVGSRTSTTSGQYGGKANVYLFTGNGNLIATGQHDPDFSAKLGGLKIPMSLEIMRSNVAQGWYNESHYPAPSFESLGKNYSHVDGSIDLGLSTADIAVLNDPTKNITHIILKVLGGRDEIWVQPSRPGWELNANYMADADGNLGVYNNWCRILDHDGGQGWFGGYAAVPLHQGSITQALNVTSNNSHVRNQLGTLASAIEIERSIQGGEIILSQINIHDKPAHNSNITLEGVIYG
jgi:hypothetical protein